MTTENVIIMGVWLFASVTVLAPRVTGWFMVLSFLIAVVVSILALGK